MSEHRRFVIQATKRGQWAIIETTKGAPVATFAVYDKYDQAREHIKRLRGTTTENTK